VRSEGKSKLILFNLTKFIDTTTTEFVKCFKGHLLSALKVNIYWNHRMLATRPFRSALEKFQSKIE
jgi:hypothetical protein